VFLVSGSPDPRSWDNQRLFYISLLQNPSESVSLDKLVEVHSEHLKIGILFMKNELGIEVSQQPMLHAIPDIW
jgi:hypothetical protein